MKPREARAVMADYLVGGRVEEESFREALRVLARDEAYVGGLLSELGAVAGCVSECVRFRSRMDELCALSAAERSEHFSELARHLEECGACRTAYWSLREPWSPMVAADAGRRAVRRLAEGLRVALDAAGSLIERGCAPPAVTLQPQTSMLDAQAPPGNRKLWTFHDPERGARIQLELVPRGAMVQLDCRVEWEEGSPAAPLRITIRDVSTESLVHAGTLEAFRREPFLLRRGNWQVELGFERDGEGHVWSFPVSFEAGSEGDGG